MLDNTYLAVYNTFVVYACYEDNVDREGRGGVLAEGIWHTYTTTYIKCEQKRFEMTF